MVTGIILARQLGPHDRGILALVLLLPSTVQTVAKLGITQANIYFINRENRSATAAASNSAFLALVLGLITCAIGWSLRDLLLSTVLPGVPVWALALALVRVPLLLLDDYLYGVLQATGKFSVYNQRLIVSEAVRVAATTIALLVFHLGLPAAVLIYTVGTILNVAWLAFTVHRTIPFTLRPDLALLRVQLIFGSKSYIQTLASHLLLRVDIYMVAYLLKNPSEAAYYSLALRFTEMVMEIPQAVGLVLYPRLAALPAEQVFQLTAQACRRTLLLSCGAALFLNFAGPFLITLVYGSAYAAASGPLPWAAVGVVAMSIYVILTRAFTSRNLQQVNIAAGTLALGVNVGLNLWLIPRMGIVGAALATAVSYSGACALLLIFFLMESRMSPLSVLLPNAEDLRYFWRVICQSAERGLQIVGLRATPLGH